MGRFAMTLEQPVYVAVGVGVLGFQRAQVLRRDLEQRAKPLVSSAQAGAQRLGSDLGGLLEPLRQVVGGATGDLIGHLPTPARDLLTAAGKLVSDLPGEARGAVEEAIAVGRFASGALEHTGRTPHLSIGRGHPAGRRPAVAQNSPVMGRNVTSWWDRTRQHMPCTRSL